MSPAAERIRAEIANHGAIPFARFMELALYCPDYGFYEREPDNIGQRGAFFTSVSVGKVFGELLAWQFADWLTTLRLRPERCGTGQPHQPLLIIEAGAHGGDLARDILTWLSSHRVDLFSELAYVIIEPSARHRQWQQTTLADFQGRIRWVSHLQELLPPALPRSHVPPGGLCAIIFSNELLDSFPVHRLTWDARQRAWFELGVTFKAGRFTWTRLGGADEALFSDLPVGPAANPSALPASPPGELDLSSVLPDGFTLEVCPAAVDWWRQTASILQSGKLLTLDYGLTEDERLRPEQPQGTLRAYYRQHLAPDVLENPGEQDITAHVDFSALIKAGEDAGLTTEAFCSQGQFLTSILAMSNQPITAEGNKPLGNWGTKQLRQFQTLIHPEHLGQIFRVLIQSAGSIAKK